MCQICVGKVLLKMCAKYSGDTRVSTWGILEGFLEVVIYEQDFTRLRRKYRKKDTNEVAL